LKEPLIRLSRISFQYDKRKNEPAIHDITFDIYRGEWLGIIGDNGSGKSTLAQILVGLLTPDEGTVSILGTPLNEETKWNVRQKIGIVFQNPDNQLIGTTVQDDIAFALENMNMSRKEMKRRVEAALDALGIRDLQDQDPSKLSGGQKQRVAIAGALALEPEAIIFDEAFVMLDPKSRRELLSSLRDLKEQRGLTIISVTHDMEEAAAADRLVLLDSGKLIDIDTPAKIFAKYPELTPPFPERVKRLLKAKGRAVPEKYLSEEDFFRFLLERGKQKRNGCGGLGKNAKS
jgi:ABC transporter.